MLINRADFLCARLRLVMGGDVCVRRVCAGDKSGNFLTVRAAALGL